MRVATLAVLLGALWQAEVRVAPEPRHFAYERQVQVLSGVKPIVGPGCAVLDGELYAHSPTLKDVRLYAGGQEVPYALSTSQTAPMGDAEKVLNAGLRAGHVVFDLAMPPRPFTEVRLQLNRRDFVATAKVTGIKKPGDAGGTALGSFTLFDLTSTGLGHSTTLPLVESTFPYLHVDLAVNGAGGKPFAADAAMIAGAEVPPSREAQTIYTTVAQTSTITQVGRHSVANFHLPAHVPVERVTFTLASGDKTNFSRSVSILAHADGVNPQDPESRESITGTIARVRMTQDSRQLREENLSVPATLGANMEAPADVQVWLENGDDKPLAVASVELEMRQRLLCFNANPAALPVMYYGDTALEPPVYDYSRTFDPTVAAVSYELGEERVNLAYAARATVDTRTVVDRHPGLVWGALLAMVGVLGWVAFRSAKRV